MIKDQHGTPVFKAYEEVDYPNKARLVSESVRLIFDGMRRKPYTDENIAVAIATHVCLACFPAWEIMKQLWGEVIGVEMDGAGVRSRGCCGVDALTHALRSDFSDYLVPSENKVFQAWGIRGALGMLIEPRRMFVFNDFKNVFAEQVIPTIALFRIEKDVMHFNVANLRVFGPD